jgi:hypothetical protein
MDAKTFMLACDAEVQKLSREREEQQKAGRVCAREICTRDTRRLQRDQTATQALLKSRKEAGVRGGVKIEVE